MLLELLEFAFRYEQVMYCVALARKDQFPVRFDYLTHTVVFSYAEKHEDEAETLLRSRELVSHWEREISTIERTLLDNAMTDARAELNKGIIFSGLDSIQYELTPSLSRIARRMAASVARAKSADWNKVSILSLIRVGSSVDRAVACCLASVHSLRSTGMERPWMSG